MSKGPDQHHQAAPSGEFQGLRFGQGCRDHITVMVQDSVYLAMIVVKREEVVGVAVRGSP